MIKKIFGYIIFRLFPLWERMGFHVTRSNDFYSPIPNTRELRDNLWKQPSELIGVDMNEKKQIQLLDYFKKFKKEYDDFPRNRTSNPYEFYLNNPNFGSVDAEILYCMIRHFKPRKIV